jgi:hypothetical protein
MKRLTIILLRVKKSGCANPGNTGNPGNPGNPILKLPIIHKRHTTAQPIIVADLNHCCTYENKANNY